jgi:chromosome partitioning protein
MKVITLLNEKGGVGKTTLATHIASGLAILGYNVVVVDADPQGHATVALGLTREPSLYNLLVRGDSFRNILRTVPKETYQVPGMPVKGNLYVVAGNNETRAIPLMTSDGMVVLRRFSELKSHVDVVIFDTSPTPSLLHASIYMATDAIVYPTECEFLSLDGLQMSLQHKDSVQPTRSQWGLEAIDVMGIVPMKYRASTVLHAHNLEALQGYYGDKIWEPLTLGTIWGEASQRRRPVFHLAPESKAAHEVWNVVRRVQRELS